MKKLTLYFLITLLVSINLFADRDVEQTSSSILPIIFRHDGYSPYCGITPPLDRETVEKDFIDIFKDTNVKCYAWGLNAGGKVSYDSRVGELWGKTNTIEELETQTPNNQMTYWNLKALIESGNCPLKIATERCHELGMKVWGRIEMNPEFSWPGCFGDDVEDSEWAWAGITLTSNFTKSHPQYRIPGGIRLDFKHPQVREHKLKILFEIAERDVDGLYLDFAVSPPYFEKPDCEIMTDFIRTIRNKLDKIAKKTGRKKELVVRVAFREYMELGLDWKTWMKEGLIDGITPMTRRDGRAFIPDAREMVEYGRKYNCPVYGTLWHILALTSPDPRPDGKTRYDKYKSRDMFNSQALLYHYWGVNAIEIATWGPKDWTQARPWYNELSDRNNLEYANKHYMVDPDPWLPVLFDCNKNAGDCDADKVVKICIADNIPNAKKDGYSPKASIFIYTRQLSSSENLLLSVNGNEPINITSDNLTDPNNVAPIDMAKEGRFGKYIFEKDWWKRGEHKIVINEDWLVQGDNVFTISYKTSNKELPELRIVFIDVKIEYAKTK